ncbi:MAG: hypothetical protein Q8O33_15490 [Pseudomonadota bacterium]|nr:hypothetical protein [Pseudomonadota bacterium]
MPRYLATLFCLLGILIQGCATNYEAPQGEPIAKLRIISNVSNNNYITVGDNPTCIAAGSPEFEPKIAVLGALANSMINNGAGVSVGVPLPTGRLSKQTTEVLVPAGKPFVLHGAAMSLWRIQWPGTIIYNYCKAGVIFTPDENSAYEAVFNKEPSDNCTFSIYQFEQVGESAWIRVPLVSAKSITKLCR